MVMNDFKSWLKWKQHYASDSIWHTSGGGALPAHSHLIFRIFLFLGGRVSFSALPVWSTVKLLTEMTWLKFTCLGTIKCAIFVSPETEQHGVKVWFPASGGWRASWVWHLLAIIGDQRRRDDLRQTDGQTRSCFSSVLPVAATLWCNLSPVTLKRRKGRNDLIKAGSSITSSTEVDSRRAPQSHRVIPAPPTDYSSWECKCDETETHATNDETHLTLAVAAAEAGRATDCLKEPLLCLCCCQDAEWGKIRGKTTQGIKRKQGRRGLLCCRRKVVNRDKTKCINAAKIGSDLRPF